MKESVIKYVGGSELSRSLQAALLIAHAAGHDPLVLASDPRLFSERQLFGDFGLTYQQWEIAMLSNNNCDADALCAICTPEQYDILKLQLLAVISEALERDGDSILGTHSPYLEIAIEALTGVKQHRNAKLLDWIIVELDDSGSIRIVETSMDIKLA